VYRVRAAGRCAGLCNARACWAIAGNWANNPYPADKSDGIASPVAVPDDGALQLGAPLRYKKLKDGTIKDLNTGLIWEVKCSGCGLHEMGDNHYRWSGETGTEETIWDWLDKVNAENGTGYAGHNDWRIPNVRELQSIVDYGRSQPAIDPIFGPTSNFYWSSTTVDPAYLGNALNAWEVDFDTGRIVRNGKTSFDFVRAVRGGLK
jgi:Protein of unknown function (DUF1566)